MTDDLFEQWLDNNYSELEGDFLEWFCAGPTPLDDDISDFMSAHAEEFESYAFDRWQEEAM
jgi:hypothetical protein